MKTQTIDVTTVIDNDACVGCGACAFASNCDMIINDYGEYIPDLSRLDTKSLSVNQACPSINPEQNEDVISKALFSSGSRYYKGLGYYKALWGGHVLESNFRSNGTSGGTGTWIGHELLRKEIIDGVIHVKPLTRVNQSDPYYEYTISSSLDDVKANSKTRYHVVEFSKVLKQAISRGGRYLFIGVPCQVKAIQRLKINNSEVNEVIAFTMSLVCGHMKSINWSNSLVWGAEIEPSQATKLQYRTKGPDIPARSYMYTAYTGCADKNESVLKDSAGVVGGKFNLGALMLPACEWCDDVVGETADITIGDAWIPKFESDKNGNNLVIVRNNYINDVILDAVSEGRLKYQELSDSEAWESQSGGFRQRGEGLSHRLSLRESSGKWVPKKRVTPGSIKISILRKKIYELRSEVTLESREVFKVALEKNDYSLYKSKLNKKIKCLRLLELSSVFFKALNNKAKRKYYALASREGK